jgi:Flp pilus assembly protein TadD
MVLLFAALLALLDFWPLQTMPPLDRRAASWFRWLGPKLPFVAVAVLVVVVTVVSWATPTAVDMDTVHAPEWRRLAALPCNYFAYLRLCVWPVDLAVLYPEQLDHPPLEVAGASLLLAGMSSVAWRARRRFPALLLGWGWFVVTLLPASGLIRPGQHAIADHYFYVPGIGLFIALVWLVAEVPALAWRPLRPLLLGATALAAGWVAHGQVKYWENSVTLWEHAAAVTTPSPAGHVNLGNALLRAGRDREAEREFNAALALEKTDFRPYVNLAVIAQRRGDTAGAISPLRQALVLAPTDARILSNLGSLLQDSGQPGEARQLLERAVALRPDLPEAQINLGVLLAQSGELSRALACFEAADRLRPGDAAVQQNLRLVRQQLAAPKPDHPPGI